LAIWRAGIRPAQHQRTIPTTAAKVAALPSGAADPMHLGGSSREFLWGGGLNLRAKVRLSVRQHDEKPRSSKRLGLTICTDNGVCRPSDTFDDLKVRTIVGVGSRSSHRRHRQGFVENEIVEGVIGANALRRSGNRLC
jgi:hypothetical protein